ncbi:MAG: hypothetical protein WKF34_10780 [Pyrinomonadaceae bacterium]
MLPPERRVKYSAAATDITHTAAKNTTATMMRNDECFDDIFLDTLDLNLLISNTRLGTEHDTTGLVVFFIFGWVSLKARASPTRA